MQLEKTVSYSHRYAGASFFAWAIFLHFQYFAFGKWSYVRTWDSGDSILPLSLTSVTGGWDNFLSYWSPQLVGGTDQLATAANLGAEGILFAFLPTWLAHGGYKVLQSWIAGYFLYRLLKEETGLRPDAALFGGLLFATAGFELHDRLAVAGLPAVMWIIARIVRGRRLALHSALLGLGFGVCTSFVYGLFVLPSVWLCGLLFLGGAATRKLGVFFYMLLGVFVVHLPAVLAGILNGPMSHRTNFTLSIGREIDDLIHRSTGYPGVILFVVALVLICLPEVRTPLVRRFWATALLILMFPFLSFLSIYIASQFLPLSGSTRLRFGFEITFWIAALTAVTLNELLKQRDKITLLLLLKKFKIPVRHGLVLSILLSIVVVSVTFEKKDMFKDMILSRSHAGHYGHPDLKQLRAATSEAPPYRVASISIIQSYYYPHPAAAWAYGFETVNGYLNLYPMNYYRYWSEVLRKLEKNSVELFKYFADWGNRVYLWGGPDRWGPRCKQGEREPCLIDFEENWNLKLLSLANVRFFFSLRPLDGIGLTQRETRNGEDIRRRVNLGIPQQLRERLRGRYIGPPFFIYENENRAPRFYVAKSIVPAKDRNDAFLRIDKTPLVDIKGLAVINRETFDALNLTGRSSAPRGATGTVCIEKYTNDRISLVATTDSTGILVVGNNYSPYWKVSVNGRPRSVFVANIAFQGVPLEEGRNDVVLYYDPPYGYRNWLGKALRAIGRIPVRKETKCR